MIVFISLISSTYLINYEIHDILTFMHGNLYGTIYPRTILNLLELVESHLDPAHEIGKGSFLYFDTLKQRSDDQARPFTCYNYRYNSVILSTCPQIRVPNLKYHIPPPSLMRSPPPPLLPSMSPATLLCCLASGCSTCTQSSPFCQGDQNGCRWYGTP